MGCRLHFIAFVIIGVVELILSGKVLRSWSLLLLNIYSFRDFPGSSVVKTQCFHCWGHWLEVVGELRYHIPHSTVKNFKKVKKKKLYIYIFMPLISMKEFIFISLIFL